MIKILKIKVGEYAAKEFYRMVHDQESWKQAGGSRPGSLLRARDCLGMGA